MTRPGVVPTCRGRQTEVEEIVVVDVRTWESDEGRDVPTSRSINSGRGHQAPDQSMLARARSSWSKGRITCAFLYAKN
jgi:hypothetical protein